MRIVLTLVASLFPIVGPTIAMAQGRTFECPAQAGAAAFSAAALLFAADQTDTKAICRYDDGSVRALAVGVRCSIAHVDLFADGRACTVPAGVHECRANGGSPSRCQITCQGS
jgi:hypothetical protein